MEAAARRDAPPRLRLAAADEAGPQSPLGRITEDDGAQIMASGKPGQPRHGVGIVEIREDENERALGEQRLEERSGRADGSRLVEPVAPQLVEPAEHRESRERRADKQAPPADAEATDGARPVEAGQRQSPRDADGRLVLRRLAAAGGHRRRGVDEHPGRNPARGLVFLDMHLPDPRGDAPVDRLHRIARLVGARLLVLASAPLEDRVVAAVAEAVGEAADRHLIAAGVEEWRGGEFEIHRALTGGGQWWGASPGRWWAAVPRRGPAPS